MNVYPFYAIFDIKVERYMRPFMFRNDAEAKRAVIAQWADEMFKDDFILFRIAEFDETTGIIDPGNGPFRIGSVAELSRDQNAIEGED